MPVLTDKRIRREACLQEASNLLYTKQKYKKEKCNHGTADYEKTIMKNLRKVLAMLLMACMLCLMFVGCGNKNNADNPGGNGGNGGNNGGAVVIESLTAKESTTTIKVGESILLTEYYEIKGSSSLSAAQKACTYESSNPDVVKINARRAEAVSAGTATITVTSNVDSTKSCSFEVVVAGVFFDRELTVFDSTDDIANEWDDDTKKGSIRTHSAITNFYYAADVYSTKWYVETDITIHGFNQTFGEEEDRWPKIGIVAMGKDSTGAETMVTFFLSATLGLNDPTDENGEYTGVKGEDNVNWHEFGVCEVMKGKHWAWEDGISNEYARHHDYAYSTGASTITYGTTFKLGVARDGANFHVYVNGNYAFSYQLSSNLDILMEDNAPINSYVGFFQFSSDATFANYSVTQNAADVEAKIPANPTYCDFLED